MKSFITILSLFFTWQCFAQQVTVSDPISLRTDDTYDFIGKIKNQYFIFHNKGVNHEIKAFDQNLKSSWEKEIELEKRRTNVLGIVPSKEDFSVIYTFRKKRKLHIFLSRFSPAGNLLDTVTIKKYTGLMLTPNFQVIRSEDRKTIVVYQIKEQKKIEAIAFNLETQKIIWEKKLQPKDMAYYEQYEQILTSNHGDMFMILKKNNRKQKRKDHHFEIHHVDPSGGYNFYSVHMQNHLTYDVHFSYDNKNDRLMAGGLFSNKNRGRANGFYFLSLEPEDHENHLLTFTDFDAEIVDNLIGKKSNLEKGVADLDVQEIVHRHDGGALLIFERNRHLERGGVSGRVGYGGGRSIVDYYYDDVLAISLHPDGKTHWKNVLHKKQYSQDDNAVYSSYFLLKTPSNLRFIFNDDIKLENTISEYVVQGSGEFERNSVMNTDDQRIQLRFAEALQVGAKEFVAPSINRNKMKLVRVNF